MHPLSKIQAVLRCASSLPEERYQARHRIAARVAKWAGTRVYDPHNNWFENPEWLRLWNGSPWQADRVDVRKFLLYNLVKLTGATAGDTAECGSFQGCSSYAILCAFRNVAANERAHHIFDSFEGISEPGQQDILSGEGVFQWTKHAFRASEAEVRRNLGAFGSVRLYKGWIPQRFDEVANAQFAFVHVDVDLYKPTLDSIAFFYPRLSPGGILLCDDYGYSTCPGAYRAMNEIASVVRAEVVQLPTGQAFIQKQPNARIDRSPTDSDSGRKRQSTETAVA